MSDVYTRTIEEEIIPEKRLGRHVEHDERSKEYGIVLPRALTIDQLHNARHRRYGGPFDQGQLRSCTGNAAAGAVNTLPIHHKLERVLNESDAVKIYSRGSQLDDVPGEYPPDDTGSSGLAVAKACVEFGYISGYQHAFSIEQALVALMENPLITGVDWYEGFDNPDNHGLVEISGQVRGGHEFEAIAFERHATIEESIVEFENSWGAQWGKNGRFYMTVSTWTQLLDSQGDATLLVP